MVKPNQNIFTKYKEMYLINSYRNATVQPPIVNNTFIGGVASVINTPALLAAKLTNYPIGTAFSAANIQNFTFDGANIECYIGVDYQIAGSAFINANFTASSPTYWKDEGSKCKALGASSFYGSLNTAMFYFPACLSIGNASFYHGNYMQVDGMKPRIFYFPLCTSVSGDPTVANTQQFGFGNITQKLYINNFNQTSNAGGINATIAYGVANDTLQVEWVTGDIYTPSSALYPNPITDLSVGTIYGTALQLIDSGDNTNAIDYYENVVINGVPHANINVNGYITGLELNTLYTITAVAVDIFYNKSTSNTVNVTTNATEPYPVSNLVSYYKMEGNVLDSFGANNGTATAITYEAGTVGQRAVFDGATSRIITTNDAGLQLTQGSIISIIKATVAGTSYRGITTKQQAYGLFLVDGVLGTYSWGSATGITVGLKTTGINLNDGLDHIVSLVFNSGVVDGTKVYIDGILKLTTSIAVNNQTKAFVIGAGTPDAIIQQINAKIDEASIWNIALTETQILEINAKLNSGQSLI